MNRFKQTPVTGIVLRSYPLFEHDRMAEVLSADHGKLRILVKRGNSQRSGLKSKIDPSIQARFILNQRKNFITCTQIDVVDSFPGIRSDFNRISMACYFMQLCKDTTVQHQESNALYALLQDTLRALHQGEDIASVQAHFHRHLLVLEGLIHPEDQIDFATFKRKFEAYSGCRVNEPLRI